MHARTLARCWFVAALLAVLLGSLAITPAPAFAAGEPTVTLSVPADVPLGESFTFTATFDNTSAIDTGYGPFIDLVLPTTGADGADTETDDGITFLSASYLGAAVTARSFTFPSTGCVEHPYARLSTGDKALVCGTPGDTLVVLQLPFGSFTPGQPPVELSIEAQLSPLADLGTPLSIYARAGFQYGNTPLDDWCCDPVILNPASPISSGWPAAPLTPTLLTLSKTYLGPEDETATGPNFPRRYRLDVDIADGQTITDLELTDLLPPSMAFLSLVTSSPAGAVVVQSPTVGAPASPPDNDLVVRFPSVTGTSGTSDASLTFEFFVPRLDAVGAAVIPPTSADDTQAENNAAASGAWDPIDPRDPPTIATASGTGPGPEHTLTTKAIAIQKQVTVAVDTGSAGPSPGDTLAYTIDLQVSDFFAFTNVLVVDRFSDGQRFDTTFAPTLSVAGNGFDLATAPFDSATYTVVLNADGNPATTATDGSTTVTFNLSGELLARGQASGALLGGCVPLSGSPTPDCASYDDGATTAQIVFRTVIQEDFSDTYPSGDPSVDEGDTLTNDVSVSGAVLDTGTLTPTGNDEADTSSASVSIARGTIQKGVYAVNGNTSFTTPVRVTPGDTVTYRLQASLPSSDVEDLRLVDYLPLPIFHATEITTFDDVVSATAPAAGHASFGPSDTFRALYGGVPALSTDATANAVMFDYGNYDNVGSAPSQIDILFTVTVRDEPTADKLFLTNQLRRIEGSTNQPLAADDAIVQIEMTQPVLRMSKGVTGSTNPGATLSPPVAGPVAFAPPGTAGAPFSGTIGSDSLQLSPGDDAITAIDSDISGVDANDLVGFVIVLENTGSSAKGAFDIAITDVLPAGLRIPVGGLGLNLKVHNGAGTAIPFSYLGGGAPGDEDDLFHNGIQLIDTSVGACQKYHPNDGSNVIIITYDLQVDPSIEPGQTVLNRATLERYAGAEGGTNHVPSSNKPSDEAAVTSALPELAKSLVASSESHTAGTDLAVGEIARYRLAVTVPEGAWSNFQLRDRLPDNLQFLDDGTAAAALISNSAGLSSSTLTGATLVINGAVPATPTFPLPDSAVSADPNTDDDSYGPGTDVYFSFGNLTNADSDDDDEYVVVEFNAVLVNTATNQDGTIFSNDAIALRGGSQVGPASNGAQSRVVEPAVSVDKSIITPASAIADAGDTVSYRVLVSNTGTASAYDLQISDPLPAQLQLNLASVSITLSGGAAGAINSSAGNTVSVTVDSLPVGASVQIDYSATVATSVAPAQLLTNTAAATFTSLPGATGTLANPTGSITPGTAGSTTGERTGAGGVNDYSVSDPASLTIATPSLTKSIVATSESHTAEAGSPRPVAVGEIVRYRLAFSLAESTSPNLQVLDVLPNGLTFLDDGSARVAFVANQAGITSSTITPALSGCANLNVTGNSATLASLPSTSVSCPLPASAITGGPFSTGTDVTFNLGDLTNSDDDSDSEFVVVEFNALVDNSAAGSNDSGDTRNNSFTVRVNGTQAGTPSSNVGVRIHEPAITNLTKTVQTAPTDAGDSIVYQVTYANATGTNVTTAFDARLLDTLPAELTLNLASVNVTLGGGATGASNSSAGNTVDITVAVVPPGGTVTINYSATVNGTVPNGRTLTNTAGLTYTSLPGASGTTSNSTGSSTPGGSGSDTGERDGSTTPSHNDYRGNSSASATLAAPTIDKLSPSPTSATIGDLVTYELRVTLPEGSTEGLVVTDQLPAGLAYETHTIVTSAGPSLPASYAGDVGSLTVTRTSPSATPGGSGEDLVLSFPTVTTTADNDPGNNAFLVRLSARVLNELANQRGTILSNTASLSFTNPNTGLPSSVSDPVAEPITLVEPVLQVAKTISGAPSPADAGATVTYEVLIEHAATSDRPAYDVVVSDPIPASLTNPAIISVTATGIAAPSAEIAGGVVRVPAAADGSFDLPLGASVLVTIEATIGTSVSPGETITNTASATWSSQDGPNAGERSAGDGLLDSGALNDYETNGSASFDVDLQGFTKAILSTSASHTSGSNVTIGEELTYALTVTLPEGNTPSLRVVDDLPAGLAYVAGSATVDYTDFSGNQPSPTITAPGGSGDDVILDFGAFSVPDDNESTNNSFVVRLTARVLDVAGNVGTTPPGQTVLTNSASVTVGASAPVASNTIDVTVVEPRMAMAKRFSTSPVYPGQTIQVTLVVTNTGTATAFDVLVEDPLPTDYFSAVSEGSTPPGFTFSATPSGANTLVRYTGGSIDPGASASFTFNVTIDSSVSTDAFIFNTATVTQATTLPGASPHERDEPDVDASDGLTVAVPDLVLTKSDGGASAVPGASITFTLSYTNTGNRAATGVTLSETVPDHTTFDAAASTPGWSCADGSPAGTVCTLTIGTLPAGDTGSASFTTRVVNPLPAGVTSVANAALITDDGTNGTDPTPGDNTATDSAPVNAAPDLVLTKSDGVSFVVPGQVITYTLTISNVGNLGATGIVLSDQLPPGASFVGASDGGTETAGVVSWPPFDLAGATSTTRTVSVQIADPFPDPSGLLLNTASVADDGTNGADPTPANNNASDTDYVRPALALTKTDGGATAVPGGTVTFTLHYTNTGEIDASGVTLTETVPQHTSFDRDSSPIGWDCAGGGAAGDTCTYSVGTVPAGASGTVDFVTRVDDALPASVTEIINAARISDDDSKGPDRTPADNSAGEQTPVDAAPDLTLTKSDGGAQPRAGEPIGYLLTYRNTGNQGASGVTISETVPEHTTFDPAKSTPGWNCTGTAAGSSCRFLVGSVAAGAEGQVIFTVVVSNPLPEDAGVILNTASISDDGANGVDPTPANNAGDAATVISPTPVVLTRLVAAREGDGIMVRWETGAELAIEGFDLYRSTTRSRANAVRLNTERIPGKGGGGAGASYSYPDSEALPDRTYYYWLAAIDEDGSVQEFGPASSAAAPGGAYRVSLPMLRR
ncbi:MAG: hypothetical protein OHK0015_13220 [Chloroflexi bacterium OHK40]